MGSSGDFVGVTGSTGDFVGVAVSVGSEGALVGSRVGYSVGDNVWNSRDIGEEVGSLSPVGDIVG